MKSAIAVFLPLTRLCRLRDIIQGMTPGLLRQSIFFLAVGMSIAGPQISDFDGAWVLKFNGQSIFKLTLATVRGRLSGSLTRPRQLAIDQDGDVTNVGPEQESLPVRGARLRGGRLELIIDGDHFSMTKEDQDRASLLLPGMRPWRLERASDSTGVILATKLTEPQYPEEIRELRTQLSAMLKEEQDARLAFDEARTEAADRKNRPEVLHIFDRYGWVTYSLAGKDAAHNFWLLVQHQTSDIQQRLLPALEEAAKSGDASMSDYAYLYDRVQIGIGRLQLWGTQTNCKNGKPVLAPVADPARLDVRRQELFMLPIREYLRMDYLVRFCKASEVTPAQ
jgi:hypothetical protein